MDYLAIVRRLWSESGRTSTIAGISTATGEARLAFDWVADFWRELQKQPYNWRWRKVSADMVLLANQCNTPLVTAGASDLDEFVPPSSDYRPMCFSTTEPTRVWPIYWLPYDAFRQRFLVGSHDAGAPQFWSFSPARQLLVGPRPDNDTYRASMQYWPTPTELVEDADVPGLPEQHHMLLVWGGLLQAAGFDAAPEVFDRAQRNHDELHSELVRREGEPIKIGAVPLAWGRRESSGLGWSL